MTKSLILLTCAALAACGSSDTGSRGVDTGGGDAGGDIGGDTGDTGGEDISASIVEKVVENGKVEVTVTTSEGVVELSKVNFMTNQQRAWYNDDGERVGSYKSPTTDAYAIGGFDNGVTFSALLGTFTAPPTGNTTYTGRYYLGVEDTRFTQFIRLRYTPADGKLVNTNSDLTVNATQTANGAFAGTVTFQGSTADLEGGFYGENGQEAVGAFSNDTYGGVVYTNAPNSDPNPNPEPGPDLVPVLVPVVTPGPIDPPTPVDPVVAE